MAKSKRSSGIDAYLETFQTATSIGGRNAATLRTRMQARRATLNEEIRKEDKFHKGSKRLIGASGDQKTREQATLEMNFAESKIKALQSELCKINSSLQAYQAAGTQETQIPIIPLALKTTTEVSFVSSFSDIISRHYHHDPALFRENIFDFQELRESLSAVTRDEAGIVALCEYYNQLQLVGKRFLHPRIRHGIAFTWYDAINGLPAAQHSVVFERACVLFNLTALHTQIAAQQDRSTEEGMDTAVKSLEKAIGYLEYMKGKFSNSPTKDMSEDMLMLLSDLMKAQAMEILWEKHQLRGLQEDIASLIDCAHKTKSVAECYRPISGDVDLEHMKEYLPGCWISIIKIKDAHYKALAHYYAAVAHETLAATYRGKGKIPEEIHTELHFLYPDSPSEVFSPDPRQHIGLMKAHLNCASLSHEYALKYNSLCRDLLPLLPLREMLSAAEKRTQLKKEVAAGMEGVMVIAPTIQSSDVKLSPVRPDFSSIKVCDMFRQLVSDLTITSAAIVPQQ